MPSLRLTVRRKTSYRLLYRAPKCGINAILPHGMLMSRTPCVSRSITCQSQPVSSLKLGASAPPGRAMSTALLIPYLEGARTIGIANQTAKNWLSAGRFPVATFLIGRRRMIRVSDLEAFVAGLGDPPRETVGSELAPPVVELKRSRGRPRKSATSKGISRSC